MRDERGADEQRIERVLDGLCRAEPSPGMEARVLERIAADQRSDAALEGIGRRWKFSPWMDVAPRWKARPAWVVAGVAGVLLLWSGFLWRIPRTTPGAGSPPQVLTGTAEYKESITTHRTREQQPYEMQAGTTTATTARTGNGQRLAVEHGTVRQQPSALAREDAAESFPAPPMPLTRQERLLLRMLSAGERTDLVATLSAGAEQAMSLQETASRREFFTPKWPNTAPTDVSSDAEELPDAVGHGALPGKVLDGSNLGESQKKEKE